MKEYTVWRGHPVDMEKNLNKFAQQGFRVVSSIYDSNSGRAYVTFERDIEPNENTK